jgi:hypothetical protein
MRRQGSARDKTLLARSSYGSTRVQVNLCGPTNYATTTSSSSGGSLPPLVCSVLMCRALRREHSCTPAPSLCHAPPRCLTLKIAGKSGHLLAFGSVSQKLLGRMHRPVSGVSGHSNPDSDEKFHTKCGLRDKGILLWRPPFWVRNSLRKR